MRPLVAAAVVALLAAVVSAGEPSAAPSVPAAYVGDDVPPEDEGPVPVTLPGGGGRPKYPWDNAQNYAYVGPLLPPALGLAAATRRLSPSPPALYLGMYVDGCWHVWGLPCWPACRGETCGGCGWGLQPLLASPPPASPPGSRAHKLAHTCGSRLVCLCECAGIRMCVCLGVSTLAWARSRYWRHTDPLPVSEWQARIPAPIPRLLNVTALNLLDQETKKELFHGCLIGQAKAFTTHVLRYRPPKLTEVTAAVGAC
jgi:hypothetical protein